MGREKGVTGEVVAFLEEFRAGLERVFVWEFRIWTDCLRPLANLSRKVG